MCESPVDVPNVAGEVEREPGLEIEAEAKAVTVGTSRGAVADGERGLGAANAAVAVVVAAAGSCASVPFSPRRVAYSHRGYSRWRVLGIHSDG